MLFLFSFISIKYIKLFLSGFKTKDQFPYVVDKELTGQTSVKIKSTMIAKFNSITPQRVHQC